MLHRFAGLVEQMRVSPEQMRRNLVALGGVVHSQRILLELARRGVDRQAAYVIVQRNAMRVYEEGLDFRTALSQDKELAKLMTPDELAACFSLDEHLRNVDAIFERVFGAEARGALGSVPG
jgi:adenylosuccinate lyase